MQLRSSPCLMEGSIRKAFSVAGPARWHTSTPSSAGLRAAPRQRWAPTNPSRQIVHDLDDYPSPSRWAAQTSSELKMALSCPAPAPSH